MELWATGFNAWGQLNFEQLPGTEDRDLKEFKCILRDERIDLVRTTLSATLVKVSTGLRTAGCSDALVEHCISKQDSLLNLAIAGNDKVVSQHHLTFDTPKSATEKASSSHIEVLEVHPTEAKSSVLKQYNSFKSYLKNDGEKLRNYMYGGTMQIVANQCTFTALTSGGEVWTWGDGRYEACLGREVSDASPATIPCVVEDLLDLPTGTIRKISSGGYVTAALTEGNDLYVWGGRPGQAKLLEDLTGAPTPVDLDGQDVLDVAVSMNHMIALTTEGRLFVVGDGGNGQLGLDVTELAACREVSLPLTDNQRIISVHAGYKNSLVVVKDIT
ncbi:RCC1/BLIP-II [Acephala macrosclerotiorum]|nr:RCC1/BLIP-II [Acephala macrosclerotiorum]